MQMVKNSLLMLAVFYMAILVFMPKQEIYYTAEEMLAKHDVALNEKSIDEGLFSLHLEGVDVYVKGIKVASIEEVNFYTFLFYNRVSVQGLLVDDSLKTMVPQETKEATLSNWVIAPKTVFIDALGSFGLMHGSVDVATQKVRLDFNESKNIQMLKPQLKKEGNGWVYETSF